MKQFSLFTLVTILLSSSFFARANNKFKPHKSDTTYIEIKGKIANALENNSGCKIELLSSAGIIDSLILENGNKKFKFTLERNKYYALRVSKKGYLPKLISVDTKLPDEIVDVFEFAFNTELISETQSVALNRDALDFPIAIVHFDTNSESFEYNQEYTNSIKKEIYEVSDGKMLAHTDSK